MTDYSRRQLAKYAVDELESGLPASELCTRLACALVASNRAKEADLLASDIESELEDRGLSAVCRITSAHPVSAELITKLKKIIKQQINVKDVSLIMEVDEGIIGGLKIETASRTWDRTAIARLRQLKESF